MKIFKSILDRPFFVILIALIIALIIPDKYSFYSLALICLIFTVSIIYTIIEKKWLRLFLSFLGFFFFLLAWISFIFLKGFGEELKPVLQKGDEEFYKHEIEKSANLMILPELKVLKKQDSIVYVGIEDEYDAECLYTGPSKLIVDLEKKIISQNDFIKVSQLDYYPTKIITEKNFKLIELKSVYKKVSDGDCIIYIAFDKKYSKFYYSAKYY